MEEEVIDFYDSFSLSNNVFKGKKEIGKVWMKFLDSPV